MRTARVAVRPLFALMIVLACIGQILLTSEKALAISVGSGSSSPVAFTDAYNRIGGSAAIGTPINDVHPWGPGCIQDFSGGRFGRSAIMQRGCSGPAFSVVGEHWHFMEVNYGSSAADIIGYPVNEGHRWDSSWAQDFDGGRVGPNILVRPDVTSRVQQLRGAIRQKFFDYGSTGGFLVFPTTNEYAWKGLQRQDFIGGSLVWDAKVGARAIPTFPNGINVASPTYTPTVFAIRNGKRIGMPTEAVLIGCFGGWQNVRQITPDEMYLMILAYPDGGAGSCGPVIAPREQRAVDWAKSQIGQTTYGGHIWSGWCELFVENAFGTSGRYSSALANYNAKKAAGQINTDTNPPAGALVFYSWGSYGHAGVSIGGGQVISTQGDGSAALPVRQHGITAIGLPYLGWAWADSSWPGR